MAKKGFSLFRFARNAGKAIDEMNTKPEAGSQKSEVANHKTGLMRKELTKQEFRHNETDLLLTWVNTNKIDIVTIAHDGNKYVVFYYATILND